MNKRNEIPFEEMHISAKKLACWLDAIDIDQPTFFDRINIQTYQSQHWTNWRRRGIPDKKRPIIAKEFGIPFSWFADDNDNSITPPMPDYLSKAEQFKQDKNTFEPIAPPPGGYRRLFVINWHDLRNFLNSNQLQKEYGKMLTEKEVSTRSFVVRIDTNEFAPYIAKGECAIIDPEKPTEGAMVLVRIGKYFHFMRYSVTDSPKLKPVRENEPPVEIDDTLDYEIIGYVVHIQPQGRDGQ